MPALVHVPFLPTKRTITGDILIAAAIAKIAAIVGGEEDERPPVKVKSVERRHDLSDALVERLDHGFHVRADVTLVFDPTVLVVPIASAFRAITLVAGTLPGEVDHLMRQVEKERTVLVLFDERHTVLGDQFGAVAGLHFNLFVMPPILAPGSVDMRKVITSAANQPAIVVETLTRGHQRRMIAQVPLAVHAGGIAGLIEHLGDRHRVER